MEAGDCPPLHVREVIYVKLYQVFRGPLNINAMRAISVKSYLNNCAFPDRVANNSEMPDDLIFGTNNRFLLEES